MVGTPAYSPQVQAAARAGTLLPNDYELEPFFRYGGGGYRLHANDLATWIQALVGGRVLNAKYQRRWLDSPQPEDPSKPDGKQYGYGIAKLHWGPNTMYFHGGSSPATTRSWAMTPPLSDTRGLDESDCVARRKADSQHPHVESARSDLRCVTAATNPRRQAREVTGPYPPTSSLLSDSAEHNPAITPLVFLPRT